MITKLIHPGEDLAVVSKKEIVPIIDLPRSISPNARDYPVSPTANGHVANHYIALRSMTHSETVRRR